MICALNGFTPFHAFTPFTSSRLHGLSNQTSMAPDGNTKLSSCLPLRQISATLCRLTLDSSLWPLTLAGCLGFINTLLHPLRSTTSSTSIILSSSHTRKQKAPSTKHQTPSRKKIADSTNHSSELIHSPRCSIHIFSLPPPSPPSESSILNIAAFRQPLVLLELPWSIRPLSRMLTHYHGPSQPQYPPCPGPPPDRPLPQLPK